MGRIAMQASHVLMGLGMLVAPVLAFRLYQRGDAAGAALFALLAALGAIVLVMSVLYHHNETATTLPDPNSKLALGERVGVMVGMGTLLLAALVTVGIRIRASGVRGGILQPLWRSDCNLMHGGALLALAVYGMVMWVAGAAAMRSHNASDYDTYHTQWHVVAAFFVPLLMIAIYRAR